MDKEGSPETDANWEAVSKKLDSLGPVPKTQIQGLPSSIEDMIALWRAAQKQALLKVSTLLTSENIAVRPEAYTALGVEMISFESEVPVSRIDDTFARNGLRDASVESLLAFAAAYPDECKRGPILARGTSLVVGTGGWRYVPFVALISSQVVLGLVRLPPQNANWPRSWRYLGVRQARMEEGEGATWVFRDVGSI